jgi:hypothetical protein
MDQKKQPPTNYLLGPRFDGYLNPLPHYPFPQVSRGALFSDCDSSTDETSLIYRIVPTCAYIVWFTSSEYWIWNRKNKTSTSLSPTVLSTNFANPRREYLFWFISHLSPQLLPLLHLLLVPTSLASWGTDFLLLCVVFTRHGLGTPRSTPPRCPTASSLPECRLLAARHHLHILATPSDSSSPKSRLTRLSAPPPPCCPPSPTHFLLHPRWLILAQIPLTAEHAAGIMPPGIPLTERASLVQLIGLPLAIDVVGTSRIVCSPLCDGVVREVESGGETNRKKAGF